MKTCLFSLLLAVSTTWAGTAAAQPRYHYDTMQQEQLDRGLVAVPVNDEHVAVTWRTLRTDPKEQAYLLYRDKTLLTPEALTQGGTFYIDTHPRSEQATYRLVAQGQQGLAATASYTLQANAPVGYLPIPMQLPDGGTTPDGRSYSYSANDCSVGDVDGDGQYELFVKWDPSNSHDNSHAGYTAPTLIDCYKLCFGTPPGKKQKENAALNNSQLLWRINLGRNIRSGAHYVQFVVMDFDGDGRAELMVKTADGTTDGRGNVIGNPQADWVEKGDRNDRLTGRILSGPEYLSVFNGLTGEVLATVPYIPERGEVNSWGDGYGNRSERYLAAAAYLDGQHPSALFCRGYYTRTVIAAWDWDGRQLTNRWTFDTDKPEWRSYAGQGNHNLRVADVDGDGCDELTYGSMAVDHDGTGLYNTGFGHGDAIHLMAFSADSDELQVWDCHENRRDGSDFRNARTGEVIFQLKSKTDVGRCMAADIDPNNPGLEMWSSDSRGIRTVKGDMLMPAESNQHDNTAVFMRGNRMSTNFGIWWDGDLLRELLDHERVQKYDWLNCRCNTLFQMEGVRFNNGSKSNPCLQADLLGDWREEVIARTPDSSELRLFLTPHPTQYRITCLMQDVPYRLSVAAENVGYNQPPEPGFYLGAERTDYGK